MKQYKKILTVLTLVLCMLLLACVNQKYTGQLASQQLADRWSEKNDYAQITCFFAEGAGVTRHQVISIEQSMKTALENASVDASNDKKRTWVDAYSTESELEIVSDRTSMVTRAFGVGGDFFLFHPLQLLSGNYFNADDLNEDAVIIDEMVAWQLFGSYDVSGMMVEINGDSYVIRGVVRSDEGHFSQEAKETDATIYVSYSILENQFGEDEWNSLYLDSYELLIANPVSHFGLTTLEEALGLEEESYELVENSSRYGVQNRLNLIRNFGVRSMNTKGILYPYWENRARAYEDVSTLIFVMQIICMIYPVLWFFGILVFFWKRKEAPKIWVKKKLETVALAHAHKVWDKKNGIVKSKSENSDSQAGKKKKKKLHIPMKKVAEHFEDKRDRLE